MKRFNLIALALLVVTGNAVAMESKASQAFAKRALNAVMTNKATTAKATLLAALAYGVYKHIQNRGEGVDLFATGPGSLIYNDIATVKRNIGKALVAAGVLGHVYGNSVVKGAQKAGKFAGKYGFRAAEVSAQKAIELYQFLNKLGVFEKAGKGLSRAKTVVTSHPRIAGAAAAATVATTGAMVAYKKGFFGKAAEFVKARFAKKAEVQAPAEAAQVVETPAAAK